MRVQSRGWALVALTALAWSAGPVSAQTDTTKKRPVPIIPDIAIELPPVADSRSAREPRPCEWGRITYTKVRDIWEISLDSMRLGATGIGLSLTEQRAGGKRAIPSGAIRLTLSYLGFGPQLRYIEAMGMHVLIDDSVRTSLTFASPLAAYPDRRTLRIATTSVPVALLDKIAKARRVEAEVDGDAMSFTADQLRSVAGFLGRRKAPLTVGPYYSCAFAP